MPTFAEMRTEEEEQIDEMIRERVLKGIRKLELEHGPDWINKIDVNKLQLANVNQCVLGQMYGGYFTGRDQLLFSTSGAEHDRSRNKIATEYGFWNDDYISYPALDRIWKEEIARRKELVA